MNEEMKNLDVIEFTEVGDNARYLFVDVDYWPGIEYSLNRCVGADETYSGLPNPYHRTAEATGRSLFCAQGFGY